MLIQFTLLNQIPYIELPHGVLAWLGWFMAAGASIWMLIRSQGGKKIWANGWFIFTVLAIGTFFTSLFFGIQFPVSGGLTIPNLPAEPSAPYFMFFAAVPWFLAGGLLNPLHATGIAVLAGLFSGLFETHSLYSIPETALLSLIFSVVVCQRYRTLPFRLLRHPIIASVVVAVLYPFLYIVETLVSVPGSLAPRLDYALTSVWPAALVMAGEFLVAGLIAEGVSQLFPAYWGRKDIPLQPAPYETSLRSRFLLGLGSMLLVLLVTLVVGDWLVAGNVARQMLQEQMASTAQMAAQSVPFFLETGQSLIRQQASDSLLLTTAPAALPDILAQKLRLVPYFRQLYLFDNAGNPITGYPVSDFSRIKLTTEEQAGIQFALQGVLVQTYSAPPVENGEAAQISFIATLTDQNGQPQGVLLGRSDLASNPFTMPIIDSLKYMQTLDGEGMLIDENQQIIYSPTTSALMTRYTGQVSEESSFYDESAPDGTRRLVYYQPTVGRSWAVVLTVPAQRAQKMALTISAPLLLIILILAVIAFFALQIALRAVTGSLHSLAAEAGLIAHGQLDHPLRLKGEDEVGQLGQAFEKMRLSLKEQLEKLNQLLLVSQSVASTLEIKDAVRPILVAALNIGAKSSRIVLNSRLFPESTQGMPTRYGVGMLAEQYAYLDEQILELSARQDRLIMSNLSRARGMLFPPESEKPGAILAVSLKQENIYYGALWIAFDQARQFTEEEIRFLSTMAGQAVLAAANARLYLNAEIGRQRLEAVISSTPEPVLVIDSQNRLLLLNPIAFQVLGISTKSVGLPVDKVISINSLVDLFTASSYEQKSREIQLENGRVYFATVSPVVAGGQSVGKVCILRDITHFKELDTIKSEFVSTVSHDLRSPLTLIRGYASMLPMIGELTEQQKGYVQNIISGIDNMTRLVTNLLDLGRLEAGVSLRRELMPVAILIESVVSEHQMQFNQKKIDLSVDVPEDRTIMVEVDRELIHQALVNLVDNALKYTNIGGSIFIGARIQPATIIFEVKDNGIGIAPLDQPRLFERFYRSGQKEAHSQRGSGLGLAIVKSIAERHGGKVWVESQLGKGSSFFIEIPLRQTVTSASKDETTS